MGERVTSAVVLVPFDFTPTAREYIREYRIGPYSGTWGGIQLTEMLLFFTHPLTYSEVQLFADQAGGLVKEMPAKPGNLARFGIAESRVIATGGPGVDAAGRVIDPNLLRAAAEAARKVDVATLLLESTETLDDSPQPPRPVSPPKITFHDSRPPPRPVSPVKKVAGSPVPAPESPPKAAQPVASSSKDDAEATAPVPEAAPAQEEMPAEPTWKPRTIAALARLEASRAAQPWNENTIARVVWTKPGEDGMSNAFLAFCRPMGAKEQSRRVKKWVEEHGGTIVPRPITDQERDDIYRDKVAQWINPHKECYYKSWEESFKNPGVVESSSPSNQEPGPEAPPKNSRRRRRGRPVRTLAETSSPKWVCTWQPHTYGALARLPAARAAEDWRRSIIARVAWTAPDEEGMSEACIVFCTRVRVRDHHWVKTEIEKHGGTIIERPASYDDIDKIYLARIDQWINPERKCLNPTWEAWFNNPLPRPQARVPRVNIRTRAASQKRKAESEDTSSTSSDKSSSEEEVDDEQASPSKRQRVDEDVAKQLADEIKRVRSEASEQHKALLAQLDARVATSKKEIASDLAKFGEEHKAAMQRVDTLIGQFEEQITGFSTKSVAALLLDGVKTVARDELAARIAASQKEIATELAKEHRGALVDAKEIMTEVREQVAGLKVLPEKVAELASALTRDAEEIAAIKKQLAERGTPSAPLPSPPAWQGYPQMWYPPYPPGWPGFPPPPTPTKP
jgi:hypothetical protein